MRDVVPLLYRHGIPEPDREAKYYADAVLLKPPERILSLLISSRIEEASHCVLPPGSDMLHTGFAHYPADSSLRDHRLLLHDGDAGELARACESQLHKLVFCDSPAHHHCTRLQLNGDYVIPGGRFRELYYWDCYFASLGLNVLGRRNLSSQLSSHLVQCTERIGYPPNGARTYFTTRSQPPLLSSLLRNAWPQDLNDERVFHALGMEHARLLSKPHCVRLESGGTELFRYVDSSSQKRLECLFADSESIKGLDDSSASRKLQCTRSACASGWDFSSRWIDGNNRDAAAEIASCDLHSFVLLLERNIAALLRERRPNNYAERAERYDHLARKRLRNLSRMHWDGSKWTDLQFFGISADGSTASIASSFGDEHSLYVSSWIPLACGACDGDPNHAGKAINAFQCSNFLDESGPKASTVMSGEQWDDPNVWPPLVWLLVQGISLYNSEVAHEIVTPFLRSLLAFWRRYGTLPEKLASFGEAGFGGEYESQTGFAWTAGVALALLSDRYDCSVKESYQYER